MRIEAHQVWLLAGYPVAYTPAGLVFYGPPTLNHFCYRYAVLLGKYLGSAPVHYSELSDDFQADLHRAVILAIWDKPNYLERPWLEALQVVKQALGSVIDNVKVVR